MYAFSGATQDIPIRGMGVWCLPEGQSLHDPAPVDDLYLPDVHCEHVPPLGPVKPALHVQSDTASLPAVEDEPAMMPSRQLASPYRMHVAV